MTRGREVVFDTPAKRPFKTVFQFKITLLDTQPPVWRRVQVPGYYTFYDLHVAIQNAMRWTDSHLHAYELGKKRVVRIESPYAVDEMFAYSGPNQTTIPGQTIPAVQSKSDHRSGQTRPPGFRPV